VRGGGVEIEGERAGSETGSEKVDVKGETLSREAITGTG
jgi:hypothetical protein